MGGGRGARLVLLALLLAAGLVGAQMAWPGLAMSAAAQADATPTITTTPSAGGPVGTSISDSATVTGAPAPTPAPTPPTTFPSQPGLPSTGVLSVDPTGSVTFELFPPTDPTCSGTPVFTSTNPLSAGTAASDSFTADAAGTWQWVATYSGDADNSPVSTACGDEPVVITAGPAALDTTKTLATADGTPVAAGAPVNASAVLVYDITVTNSGGSPGTTSLSETVPAGTTYTGSGEGWSCATGSVAGTDCSQSVTVGPGATTTVHYTLTVDNPLPAGITAIGNQITSSAGTCSSCSTSNTVADRLYWTDRVGGIGTIMVANLDGSGVTTLVTGQNSPEGVAVGNDHIYWSNAPDGTIMEANLDGADAHEIVSGQALPFGVAVDGSHLYWANFIGSTIMEANLDSCTPGPCTVVNTLLSGSPDVSQPQGVAVANGNIYWANNVTSATQEGTLMEASLAGCAPPTPCTDVTTLASSTSGAAAGAVLGGPTGVAVNSSEIYWTNYYTGTIWMGQLTDVSGTATEIVDTGVVGLPFLALDSSHVYWTEQNTDTIMRANLDGSDPTSVVTGQEFPTGIAVGPP